MDILIKGTVSDYGFWYTCMVVKGKTLPDNTW